MTTKSKQVDNETITEMAEAGVLYSHKKSKADPRMKPFIVANRYQLDVLDAGAVLDSIEKTAELMKDILSNDGTILFVGTTPASRDHVEYLADKLGQPYVVNRWLGGTLTNLDMIKKRIKHYIELKEKRAEGELEKYTKKEQVEFDKEIDQLTKKFEGIKSLKKLPDAVFVINTEKHPIAIREAETKDVPVIGVIDTNDNPDEVDYPIIANDHSKSSLKWVINKLESSIVISDVKNKDDDEDEEEEKNNDK